MGAALGCKPNDAVEVEVKDEGNSSADGWKKYVDEQLIAGGCSDGMIIGLKGELWAKSAGIGLKTYTTVVQDEKEKKSVEVNELANIIDFSKSGTKPDAGLRINQVKYVVVRSEKGTGKKDPPFVCYARHEKTGVAIAAAKTCIVVGRYNEADKKKPTFAGATNQAVERLAAYLRDQGY